MTDETERQEIDEGAAFKAAASEVEGELTGGSDNSEAGPHKEEVNQQEDSADHTDSPSWMNSIPDDARKEFEQLQSENQRLNHKVASQTGRVKAAEARWKKAQQQLEESRSAAEQGADIDDLIDADFAEDYPELAETMKNSFARSLGNVSQRMKSITDPLSTVINGELESISTAQAEENQSAVLEAFPDAAKMVNDPAYDRWLALQPAGLQKLASESTDPQDAIYILSQFQSQHPGKAAAVRRSNQLSAMGALPSGRGGSRNTEFSADDEDALFKQAARELDG
ncbi:hypothetical protein [Vibrio litoralis]|uniref:hypothetical protein n=1 Tax=Vibrio litoralis TaxID=335972 RepID=UPI000417CF4E|nr:hypothetical protein [Vibrio litoralis]